jgi:hypothetical protein
MRALARVASKFFGADIDRDKETFFLALCLEMGKPKPLDQMRMRYGGKKAATLRGYEPDADFVMRFAEIAVRCKLSCRNQKTFINLYTEYEQWYERHHPDVH